jgi:hypothetical protein
MTWKPPPMGKLKVNWDARINKNKGVVGMGIVIHDHKG